MNIELIYNDVKERLSEHRFCHTMGVVRAAQSLAKAYDVNDKQAELAALLHDCAKELPLSEMQKLVDASGINVPLEIYQNGALLHGTVGAIWAKNYYHVDDSAVLEAIRVHTTGKINMGKLDKIIFLADYIESNRNFLGVEELRKIAFQNLDLAVLAAYDKTIDFLIQRKQSIYFSTILARNDMVKRINEYLAKEDECGKNTTQKA